jgi:hypothetical protein
MFHVYRSSNDVALDIDITRKVTMRLSFQFRSWTDDSPFYNFHVFLAGTFLGMNPHTTRPLRIISTERFGLGLRSCASNGIVLISATYQPKQEAE